MITIIAFMFYILGDDTVCGLWHVSGLVIWVMLVVGFIEFIVEAVCLLLQ